MSPDTASLTVGDQLQLSAVARDRSASPVQGQVIRWTSDNVAAAAVNAVPDADKANAISTAIRSAPGDVGQQVLDQLMPDQKVTNAIWLWIVRTFAVVLVLTTIALIAAIFVGFWRKVDTALVQILLTVVTTVAGILAGFISGRASTTKTGG